MPRAWQKAPKKEPQRARAYKKWLESGASVSRSCPLLTINGAQARFATLDERNKVNRDDLRLILIAKWA